MSAEVEAVIEHVSDERQVTLALADGPVLKKHYGKRVYRVATVTLTYRRADGDLWKVGAVALSGPYVKKDGTDGVDSNHERLWNWRDWSALPWLLALVEAHAPAEVQP